MLHRSEITRALTAVLLLAPASLAQVAPLDGAPAPAALLDELDVARASLHHIDVESAGDTLRIQVEIAGRAEELVLWPHSLRSPDYKLLVQGADGEIVEAQPSPVATYRGIVANYPESAIAASYRNGSLDALLQLAPEADVWSVQPVVDFDQTAPNSLHVVFSDADALPVEGTCGNETTQFDVRPETPQPPAGGIAGQATLICEIACDADNKFFNKNGQSVASTENDIESVLNGVELIYQSDIDIGYEITTIIVRTAEPDPYSTNIAGDLLDQFRSEWLNNQGGIHRDIAHLFTGYNLDGGTIGVAWLSQICGSSLGFGLSQSKFSGNMNSRIALTAHELGHNWSSGHCDSTPGGCNIMCSAIGACGPITFFVGSTVNKIANYAATKNCLDDPSPPTPPIISAVIPAQVPALVPGPVEHVTLIGEYFDTVTDVEVDGVSLGNLFPPQFSVVSDTEIAVNLPLLNAFGTVDVTVFGLEGTGSSTLEIVGADPPVQQLGLGGEPETLTQLLPLELTWSGQPGNVFFTWASFTFVPSVAPGTFSLDIGNNFLDLYLIDFPVVEPQGWVQRSFNNVNLPPATTVWFQAFEYDVVTGALPAQSTNTSEGFWLF